MVLLTKIIIHDISYNCCLEQITFNNEPTNGNKFFKIIVNNTFFNTNTMLLVYVLTLLILIKSKKFNVHLVAGGFA